MKNRKFFIPIILCLALFLSACTPTSGTETPSNPPDDSNGKTIFELESLVKEKDKKIDELETNIKSLESDIKNLKEEEAEETSEEPTVEYGQEGHILVNSVKVLKALKEEDMESLKKYIHPEKGVRLTSYGYVDFDKDFVVKRDELVEMFKDPKTRSWGEYDGRGDPIELSLKDYYKEFIYDQDFLNPHLVAINNTVSMGNTIDNVKEAYPEGEYIESYFKGFDEQFEGIDWRSLKLVFEEYKGKWYLVGIIHNEWTV
nr:hypothetical protein [Tissierella sp.]